MPTARRNSCPAGLPYGAGAAHAKVSFFWRLSLLLAGRLTLPPQCQRNVTYLLGRVIFRPERVVTGGSGSAVDVSCTVLDESSLSLFPEDGVETRRVTK